MKRITSDKRDYGFSFLNIFYGKNEEIWVRGGGPAPEYKDCSLYDFIRRISKEHGVQVEPESDEDLSWQLHDMLWDGPETKEGLIAFFNVAAIQAAETRERLKEIEDILGDDYDIDRLQELMNAEKDGRCTILKVKPGETLYYPLYIPQLGVSEVCHIEKCSGYDSYFFSNDPNSLACRTREEAEAVLKKLIGCNSEKAKGDEK